MIVKIVKKQSKVGQVTIFLNSECQQIGPVFAPDVLDSIYLRSEVTTGREGW